MKLSNSQGEEETKNKENSDSSEHNNKSNFKENFLSPENKYDFENRDSNKNRRKLICNFCKKEFDFQSALDKHIRIHTGEKPFVCDFPGCNISFAQVSNLIRHRRTHTGEKPFKCDSCDKTFTSTSNLKLHIKSHLNAPKEKLYCFINDCERFYFSLETLKKHLQKSHRKEYDLLKEANDNKNFNQIYMIIKDQKNFRNNLGFINFKDLTYDRDNSYHNPKIDIDHNRIISSNDLNEVINNEDSENEENNKNNYFNENNLYSDKIYQTDKEYASNHDVNYSNEKNYGKIFSGKKDIEQLNKATEKNKTLKGSIGFSSQNMPQIQLNCDLKKEQHCYNQKNMNTNNNIKENENQYEKNEINKATNYADDINNVFSLNVQNQLQKNQKNYKSNEDNQKRHIFSSVSLNMINKNNSASNSSNNHNKINFINSNNSNKNDMSSLESTGNLYSKNPGSLDVDNQDMKEFADDKQNFNLNKYLEKSINNIILSFITRGAQINAQPINQSNQNQNQFNINQNLNESKQEFHNQSDILNFLNNNIKNDCLNLSPNIGNLVINLLLEAHKQNNNLNGNGSNHIFNINGNIINNNNNNYNTLNQNQDVDNVSKEGIQTNRKLKFKKHKERIIKSKKANKYNFNSTSVSPSIKKPELNSVQDNQNENNRKYQNSNFIFDYQKNNDISFDKNNLSLNENISNNNDLEEFESHEEENSDDLKIQKSSRMVKRNKFRTNNEIQRNNIHKNKIYNNSFPSNSNQNEDQSYFQNYPLSNASRNDKQNFISNNEINKMRQNSKFLNYADKLNINSSIIEEDMNYPREKYESETNISNNYIEYENPYSMNQRNYFKEEGVNKQDLNIGNLVSRYIFTPNDKCEITNDLYEQELQSNNNNKNNDFYLTQQNYLEKNNMNIENNLKRNNQNQVDKSLSNFYIKNASENDIINNISHQNHKIANDSSNQVSKRKHSSCFKKRSLANNKSHINLEEIDNNINYIKSKHSYGGCCKHRHKNRINSDISTQNLDQSHIINNEYTVKSTPVIKETNGKFNENLQHKNDNQFNLIRNQIHDIDLNQNNQVDNYTKNNESSVEDSVTKNANKELKSLTFNQAKSAFENRLSSNMLNNNFNYSSFGVGYPKSNFKLNTNLNNSRINNSLSNNYITPTRPMMYSIKYNDNCNNSLNELENSKTENVYSDKNSLGCCRSSLYNNLNYNQNNYKTNCNYGNNYPNRFSGNNKDNEDYKNNEVDYDSNRASHGSNICCSTLNYKKESNSISNSNEENNKINNYNVTANNHNQNRNISNLNSNSSLITAENHRENTIIGLNESKNKNSVNNQFNNNNYEGQLNQTEVRVKNVKVPVFKKNSNHVKIFKPAVKNKIIVDPFDSLNNFLAPIDINNTNQNNTINSPISSNSPNQIFSGQKSINIEDNITPNKKYPQLCSKNLFLDSHNVDNKLKTANVKKIIRNDSKFEENFLDKKCIEICGDLLICPELLPINCQKYLNRECDCVEKCKEKDSIYREFISSNKAITDLEF